MSHRYSIGILCVNHFRFVHAFKKIKRKQQSIFLNPYVSGCESIVVRDNMLAVIQCTVSAAISVNG